MIMAKQTLLERLSTPALLIAGISVSAIGLLCLLGWLLDTPIFHTWKVSTLPMSPIMGGLSLFFGTALCFSARMPISPTAHLLTSILGWFGAIAALLLFTLRLLGVYWPVELLGLQITGTVEDVPIGYISPVSAFCLLLVNTAFLTLLPTDTRSSWREWLAWSFGGLVSFIGLALLLAYAFGTPLLAGKLLIHPALNSNINLLIMGLALLALAARHTCQQASPDADTFGASPYFLMFAVLTAGIIAVGYDHYRETEIKFRHEVESKLLVVSKLKTGELVRWRKDLLGDASLTQSAVVTSVVRQLLEKPHSLTAQQELQDWLGTFQRHLGALEYGRAVLLDTHGSTLISVPDTAESLPAALVDRALASLKSGKVTVQDFYRDEHDLRVYLALIVPIFDKLNGNHPLGMIVLRIDPTIYLYPFIQSWPTPSNSAETLLVRLDGNQILYLNDLRFQSNAALQLSRPLVGNTEITGISVIMGQRGIQDGLDYRGAQVIAALSDVPGSPWYLVTKMDAAEVFAPLRNRLWLTLLLMGLLIGSLATVMFLLWRHQRLILQKGQLESALKIKKNEEAHQLILSTIMDGFLRLDDQMRVLEANPAYCLMSGYSEKELLNLRVSDLSVESPEIIAARIRNITKKREDRFETRHRRKDGSIYEVEISAQFRSSESGQFVCFLHDITKRKHISAALQESEQNYKTLINSGQALVWTAGSDKLCHFFNSVWLEFTGRTLEQESGDGWTQGLHPDDFQHCLDIYFGAFEQRKNFRIEYRLRRHDGEYRWIINDGCPRYNSQGKFIGYIGHCFDITERKEAEDKLQLAASVFTHAQEGIVITDVTGSIIEVNDSFCRITGYDRDEILGQNPRILKSGRHEEDFYATMWHDLQEKQCWSGEIWNRRKDGEVYAELLNISALLNSKDKTERYIALFTDITELKTYELQLVRNAQYDALTNLPNRVLLADRLRQGIAQVKRRGNRLAVAFLDLDGFKEINDNYGHDAGDRLLIALASRMKNALREGDTLARIGGDEFIAVLFDLPDIEASVPMLGRLLAAAAQPVQVDNFTLQVSASIGLTFYPQTEDIDADQLLRQADQAMYQAKQSGKNRFHFFNTDQDRIARSHHEDLERIRRALFREEFVLYYQPKVNMRTGTVIGAEALIRWQHPERGLLPPLAFLPVIEDDHLSVELGKWVIDTALTEMEHWRAVGLDIPVSVNISSRQLQQADFVERLREVLATHPSLSLGELELEVLETSALKDLSRVSQIIEDCRELGVMFSLDDFGTGYSSLTYLKRLPVGQIKIDQSFVRDMLEDSDDLAILEGVLKLSHSFRRQVIAEGVETVEHGVMLLQLGCELAQGFVIAYPMPASDLLGWTTVWSPDPAWINVPSVSSDDIPLLFATVEHRSWIVKTESYLKGEQEAPPPMNLHQCSFGSWLDAAYNSANPTFQTIERLHQQVHALASELLEFHVNGRNTEALARLAELHALRDALIEQLKVLAKEHWQAKSGTGSED